ncbi:MAG: hypothetical protein Ta2A_12020 [Treponemataceae bacterium]|nr:MAG: hypothetical protein Ta2A_12020 [Treponemataceae bacterium]
MAANTLFNGDAYWNDSWVQELDGDEERLYHFYITSPALDKSGVYKQTERAVEFYVRGLGIERIREITEKFAKAKKVIRCGEWIIVPSSLKHQNYKNLPTVVSSITEHLKKLPDEVFEALRECDYPFDLDAIKPKNHIDYTEPTHSLPIDYTEPTHSLPQTRREFNLIQSNLKELEIELNINPIQRNDDAAAKKLSAHFLQLWQQGHGVFNITAGLKRPKDWSAFWETCIYSEAEIDIRVKNFIDGVKSGAIERKYVPRSPDTFVLNSWLETSAEPFKKPDKKIANDSGIDTSKYFRSG